MFLSPSPDSGVTVALGFLSIYIVIGMAIVGIPLIESVVLYILKWGEYLRCLGTSYAMNFVSTLAGALLVHLYTLSEPWRIALRHTLRQRYIIISNGQIFLGLYVFAILITIPIEWWVLNRFAPAQRGHNIKLVLAANFASYVILTTLIVTIWQSA